MIGCGRNRHFLCHHYAAGEVALYIVILPPNCPFFMSIIESMIKTLCLRQML